MEIKHTRLGLKTRGVSLVELLVYIVIVVLLAGALVTMIIQMGKSYQATTATRLIALSGETALDRMEREIRRAKSINDAGSSFGIDFGQLSLNTTNDSGQTITTQFFISSSTMVIKEGAAAAISLTSAGSQVNSLIFRRINTANSQAVKIELLVSAEVGGMTKSAKFYGMAVVRK